MPKVRLTWYMTSNYTQPFLETVAPIGFLNLCNLLNMLYCQVYDDFMSNLLSVGLTMVVIIPSFRGQGYHASPFNHFTCCYYFSASCLHPGPITAVLTVARRHFGRTPPMTLWGAFITQRSTSCATVFVVAIKGYAARGE